MSGKNKFFKGLTAGGKGIIATRAAIIAEDVASEQQTLVSSLQKEKRNLIRDINKLEDMGPDTDTSLRVVSDKFNPSTWVAQYQDLQLKLIRKEEELAVAEATLESWFNELPE